MLRAELAGRLAERLRVDERLLRDELRRAAGEKRAEVRATEEVTADANHAVKQLLRACLESDELADAVLPEVMESGVVEGLLGENVFKQLWQARQRGERLDLANAEALTPQEKRLAADALFWPGAPPESGTGPGMFAGTQVRSASSASVISCSAKSKPPRNRPIRFGLAELQRAKSSLDKELRKLGRP